MAGCTSDPTASARLRRVRKCLASWNGTLAISPRHAYKTASSKRRLLIQISEQWLN